MEHVQIFYLIGTILGYVAQLIVVIACLFIFKWQRNTGTFLMLVGSVLNILFSLLGFIWTLISAHEGAASIVKTVGTMTILGHLPSILFAVGLLLLGAKYLKKHP